VLLHRNSIHIAPSEATETCCCIRDLLFCFGARVKEKSPEKLLIIKSFFFFSEKSQDIFGIKNELKQLPRNKTPLRPGKTCHPLAKSVLWCARMFVRI